MGNSAGAGSGAINGAKAGAMVGGPWGAAIGATIGGVTGYFSPDIVAEQRKSLLKYNADVTKYTQQSVFDLQRQRVSERMRTSQALSTYQDAGKTSIDTLKAQYAAMDVTGSSAKALGMTIDFQTDQAMAQEWFNFDVGIDNFNTQLRGIVNNGISRLSNAAGSYVNPNQAAAAQNTMQTAMDMYDKYDKSRTSSLGLQGASSYYNIGGSSGFSADMQLGSSGSYSDGTSYSSMMSSGDWSNFSLGGS